MSELDGTREAYRRQVQQDLDWAKRELRDIRIELVWSWLVRATLFVGGVATTVGADILIWQRVIH